MDYRSSRPSASSSFETSKKPDAAAKESHVVKKRAALTNITNRENGSRVADSLPRPMVPCSVKTQRKVSHVNNLPASANIKLDALAPYEDEAHQRNDRSSTRVHDLPSIGSTESEPRFMGASPISYNNGRGSLDETMSTYDFLKCSEFDVSEVQSVDMNNTISLDIPTEAEKGATLTSETTRNSDIHAQMEINHDNSDDPQLYAVPASYIYKHLRASEEKKRSSFDYMERIQRDITSSMRAILIDWLVEVAEEYRLVPETLYLAVNYIDRYLSTCAMSRTQLQLLGIACLMIAAKYEEIHVPAVKELCYVTDNTYSKKEVLQMESSVLNLLKFDMAFPTAHCFLRLFIHAAQNNTQTISMKLECLASYLTELSLPEYHMLRYAPSLIAASAIFLAKFILSPSISPWNSTLREYTFYKPSELSECVKALHRLCLTNNSSLPAVREKYSQHKYKFVAKKYCPITIPIEKFQD